jgi:NAD(P)-dependent dehydrogenase (short-subunit alcohol dehydrogenase family)/pimeloyl-ACP methyl ester carboxylesterase
MNGPLNGQPGFQCRRPHTLVTGASSGIGRATALRLAAAGHHVYAGIRRTVDGDALVRDVTSGQLTPVILDVTNAEQIADAATLIARHTANGLNGLVDNAGIGIASPTELLPLDTFRRQLEINVVGQLAVTQALLPLLREAQGRIVVISTIGVRFLPPFAGPLDATKAAVAALADALRQELAPWGIRVVLVEPASINSPAADKVARDAAATMASATRQGRALYEEVFSRMLAVMTRREKAGSPPAVVAETILAALTTSRPRAVYLTGKNARRLAMISLLPTPLLDAARRRIFRLPSPGAFVTHRQATPPLEHAAGIASPPSPDGGRVGRWRSDRGRQAYAASYAAAMALLPAPAETLDVPTDFGTVRVYRFVTDRTSDAAPVVLLPGRSSGVPMWARNLTELADRRPVYALDALGDAGLSVQTRPLRDVEDQATWIDQTFAGLGLTRSHLVGHSFGGWSAMNYAARHASRIASLSLIEPVLVLQGLRWKTYARTVPAALPFLPRSWREKGLAGIGGTSGVDRTDPVARMISDAAEHYAAKLPMPVRITARQLQNLPMPVYVAMAAGSSPHDPVAAVRVARQNIPDVEVRLWPQATRSLPMEYPHEIDAELLSFMARHETTDDRPDVLDAPGRPARPR